MTPAALAFSSAKKEMKLTISVVRVYAGDLHGDLSITDLNVMKIQPGHAGSTYALQLLSENVPGLRMEGREAGTNLGTRSETPIGCVHDKVWRAVWIILRQ